MGKKYYRHSREKLNVRSIFRMFFSNFIKRKVLLFSLVVLLIILPIVYVFFKNKSSVEAAWYDNLWLYRKELVFNNSAQASNLSNFAVMVKLTSSNFDFSQAKTNGEDVRFTDSDGVTLLSYEIESYNAGSHTAVLWVNVPQIDASSATDYIYMYWGNAAASDAQNTDNTWNSSYKGVYHLADSAGSTTVIDSSGLSNNLTSSVNTNTQYASASGKIGNGFLTMGSPHHIPNMPGQNDEQFQDMVLDSNNYPVIAYWEATTSDLIIVHCNDRDCKGDDESVTTPDTLNATGYYPSIQLDSNGYPVVSYYDANQTDLDVLHCNDVNCAGGDDTISLVDTAGNVGYYSDLHLDANGYPVVIYYDLTNTNLKLVHCNDVNCTGGNESVVTLDGTTTTVGAIIKGNSLDLNSLGYPVITTYDSTNADLHLIVCNDVNCAGGDDTPVAILTTNDVGRYSKLILDGSNFPRIAYEDWTARDTYFLYCNDVNCAGGDDTPVVIDNTTSDYPDFSINGSGFPVFTYQLGGAYPAVAVCSNSTCSSNTKTTLGLYNQYLLISYSNISIASDDSLVVLVQSIGKDGYNDLNLYTTSNKLKRAYDSDFDFGTGSFSLSAWFKAKEINHTQQNTILSRYDADQGYKLYLNYGGYPCFGIDDDATWGPDDSVCTSPPSYTSNVDDGQAAAAQDVSIVLDGSGYPMIAYYDASTQTNLEFIHCNDLYCSGGDETTAVIDSTGSVGNQPIIVLDSTGYPVISYQDVTNGDLKLAHCGNANCTAGNTVSTVDNSAASVGTRSSLTLDGNGYPVITYFDGTNGDLKFVHCNDVNCAGGDDGPIALYTLNTSGNMSSVKLDASGYPVIAFLYNNANDLMFIHCNDVNCAGGDDTASAIDTTGTTGHWPSLQLDASGYPVIAYFDYSNNNLRLMHCNDVNCAGGNESINTVSYGGYGVTNLILNSSGNPVILHTSQSNWTQMLTTCNDVNCAGGDETTNLIRHGLTNSIYGSLILDASGYPVIASRDFSGDIGLFRPGSSTYNNPNTKDDGAWHHLVGVKNGTSSITLYLDGIAVATDSTLLAMGTLTSNSSSLNFAEDMLNGLSTNGWGGWLDEVQIDTTARTSDWVAAEYLSESDNFINTGATQNGPASVNLSTFTDNAGAIKNNLVGYWKFDEGYSTIVHNSSPVGSAINGTLANSPTWNNNGKVDKALNFDGMSNYVTVPSNSNLNFTATGTYTTSVWVNPTTITNPVTIVYKSNTGNGYAIGSNSGRAFVWFPGATAPNANGNSLCRTLSPLPTNQWSLLTFTWNNGNCKLYLNGILQSDIAVTGATDNSASATLFAYGSGAPPSCAGSQLCFFPGLLDDIKIYSAELTPDEVKMDRNGRTTMSMGSLSDSSGLSGGGIASNSAGAQYCIPGDTNACIPPFAEWNLEEGNYINNCSTETVFDTSTHGLNLISCPNASGPTTKVIGKIGSAGYFDGIDDELRSTNTSLDMTGEITVQAWVKITDIANAADPEILNKSNNNNGYALEIGYSSRNPKFRIGNGTAYSVLSGTSTLSNGVWYFITGTLTPAGVQKIYVNGKEEGSTTITGSLTAAVGQDFRLGVRGAGTYLNGAIDQVKIYNYARTPAQIAWDFNKGKPIGWWKLDECSGIAANDTSGNGNSGSIAIGATGTQSSAGTCTDGLTTSAWNNGKIGKFNSSLNFDGTDDYISTTDSPSLDMATMSVSAWIKTTSTLEQCVVERNNSTFYFCTVNGKVSYYINSVGAPWQYSNKSINNNVWHHILATWDGTNKKIYIDGILDITTAGSGGDMPSSAVGLNIGVRKNAGVPQNYFNGQIDDVRLYNYALTPVQIKQVYNNGAINFGPATGAP